MAAKDNKEVVRKGINEIWNEGKLDRIDQYYASNTSVEDPFGIHTGIDAVRKQISMLRTAFPDTRVNLESVIGEGDHVAYVMIARGTHRGRLMDVEPSGREVNIKVVGLARFENGKVVNEQVQFNLLDMLVQIGAVAPPEFMAGDRGARA